MRASLNSGRGHGAMALAVGATVTLVMAGCSKGATKPTVPPATKAAIEGKTWRAQSVAGVDTTKLAALQGGVTLRFAGGSVQVASGCNQLRGSYTLDEGVLETAKMAGTMMACPEPGMSIETAVKKALAKPLRATLAGGRLTLASEDEDQPPVMVLAVEVAPQIDGTWNVNGVNDGRKALMSTLRGTTLTVTFAGGTVSGNTGCNTFRGTYKVQGERVAIGRLTTTRKGCPGDGVMKQETNYVAALEKAETWKIERGELTLFAADGMRLVTGVGR